MNDTALNAIAGTGGIGAALVTLFLFARWVVTLWATIRREELAAAKENSANQRADGLRMTEALLTQARSNAELAGAFQRSNAELAASVERSNAELVNRVDQLWTRLDTIFEWRQRTPVEGVPIPGDEPIRRDSPSEQRRKQQRMQTSPRGYRPPVPGPHHDE